MIYSYVLVSVLRGVEASATVTFLRFKNIEYY